MNERYQKHLDLAERDKKINEKFTKNLKKKPAKKVDAAFHAAHEEAFENIDCLECANCCKTTSPIFRDVDINRLAKHFRIKASSFVDQYLHLDHDGDYVLNSAPCPFLGSDNYCSVYDHRPKACREYPHTDRKNMNQLLNLTYKNSLICPAVSQILETIRK